MMNLYEKLPTDFLIEFYNEMMKNIEKGILSKNMYYELGLMISVAKGRGIILGKPCDFNETVNQEDLDSFMRKQGDGSCASFAGEFLSTRELQ